MNRNELSDVFDAALMMLPCVLAISDAIPRPGLSPARLALTFPRKNGRNSLSILAAGIGLPAFASESGNSARFLAAFRLRHPPALATRPVDYGEWALTIDPRSGRYRCPGCS